MKLSELPVSLEISFHPQQLMGKDTAVLIIHNLRIMDVLPLDSKTYPKDIQQGRVTRLTGGGEMCQEGKYLD